MQDPNEFDEALFPGLENHLIRYYYYLQRGLDILNSFRNLFLGILGLYFVLKIDNWWILVAMFIPSVLALMIAGYYATHRVNKVLDWLGLRFATHYGIRQYNLQQGIYDTLQEINKKL